MRDLYRFDRFSTSNGIERYEESVLENPESEDASLVVKGSYSYPGTDGKMVKVKYVADKDGFRPEGDLIHTASYGKVNIGESQTKTPEVNQRFNRQYVAESSNQYNSQAQTFENLHTEVSHFLQKNDQDYAQERYVPYTQNHLQENDETEHYNYDRSFIELLKSNNHLLNNYNPQSNRPKPIIAILGDDGKLIDSTNFENLNIPESLLEILSRGNVPNESNETPSLKAEVETQVDLKPVEEAITEKSIDSKTESESSSVTSETVDQAVIESSTASNSEIESSKS
ncbi:hypothetical protein FQR65_LT01139 [Abscondita terminalis]|nr:hypothetical protein FQR65_LT01139 [Abscondita terminalis]